MCYHMPLPSNQQQRLQLIVYDGHGALLLGDDAG
jgi:hypothetical protein